MIQERLTGAVARDPERPFLTSAAGSIPYADFLARCTHLAACLDALEGERFACYMADSEQLITIMLAAGMSSKSLLMLNREYTPEQLPALLGRYGIDLLISDTALPGEQPCPLVDPASLAQGAGGEAGRANGAGEILILTSGTTGEPKCARYSWADLFAQVRQTATGKSERWLLAYRLNHFAGLQMLVHVISTGGTLVLAESSRVADALQAIADFGVTHVSSTPTFWRYALATLAPAGKRLALEHITLGSEAVSGALLDQLRATFPEARIVHIYASTEAGSCVSVSDMRPGLPANILERDENAAVQFQVRDGELHIRSRHGMTDYLGANEVANRDGDGWLATGDLVQVEGDRIFFLGRRSETINVGGVKVHPLEVENTISALPEVKLARVYGQENPVVGQIVAADIVPAGQLSHEEVEKSVRQACNALSRHARPRVINIVESIETSNFKLKRNSLPS